MIWSLPQKPSLTHFSPCSLNSRHTGLLIHWLWQASFCFKAWIQAAPWKTFPWYFKFILQKAYQKSSPEGNLFSPPHSWSDLPLTCTQLKLHLFLPIIYQNYDYSLRISFFILLILFHFWFSTRCKLNEGGALSVRITAVSSEQSLLAQGKALEIQMVLRKQQAAPPVSPSQGMYQHPSEPWGSPWLLPLLPPQSTAITKASITLQVWSSLIFVLLVQATVINNLYHCQHLLSDVLSLDLLSSNPLNLCRDHQWSS